MGYFHTVRVRDRKREGEIERRCGLSAAGLEMFGESLEIYNLKKINHRNLKIILIKNKYKYCRSLNIDYKL